MRLSYVPPMPNLLAVLPIVRAVDVGDGRKIHLISLEVWSEFVVFHWAVAPAAGATQYDWGRWQLQDNVGTDYERHSGGGHSNGEMKDFSQRWLGSPPLGASGLVVSCRDSAGNVSVEATVPLSA
jgi:hypothetical protein